jgi:hypothetical protein
MFALWIIWVFHFVDKLIVDKLNINRAVAVQRARLERWHRRRGNVTGARAPSAFGGV